MEGQPAAVVRYFSSKERHLCHVHSHSGWVDLDMDSRHRGRNGDLWGIWDLLVQTIHTHRDGLMHIEVVVGMFDVLDRGHWTTLLNRVEAVQKIRS